MSGNHCPTCRKEQTIGRHDAIIEDLQARARESVSRADLERVAVRVEALISEFYNNGLGMLRKSLENVESEINEIASDVEEHTKVLAKIEGSIMSSKERFIWIALVCILALTMAGIENAQEVGSLIKIVMGIGG